MLIAYVLDLILGDPLWFPHPIRFVGTFITWFNKHFYKDSFLRGIILLVSSVIVVTVTLNVILRVSELLNIRYFLTIFFLYTSLATKSLLVAANSVVKQKSIEQKRIALSYIVSRDTSSLNENEIHKAVIETVAENTIDGIISPLFYIFIGFLIGFPVETVFIFKTVSTLDSMVGYKSEKYMFYGKASAKTDDLLNFIPARIGSVIMLLAGINLNLKGGVTSFKRDRLKHDSPNAAHSESVMAGLLDIQLGGSSVYKGVLKEKPTLGSGLDLIDEGKTRLSMRVSLITSLLFMGVIIWIMVYMGQTQNVL